MSQLRVFALVITTLFTMVACSGQDGSVELTDNQKNLVAERIAPHGAVVMAGQAVVSAVASGLFQYPRINIGPKNQTSPRSPVGTSRKFSSRI